MQKPMAAVTAGSMEQFSLALGAFATAAARAPCTPMTVPAPAAALPPTAGLVSKLVPGAGASLAHP